jgi:hypothetical protein
MRQTQQNPNLVFSSRKKGVESSLKPDQMHTQKRKFPEVNSLQAFD